MIRRARGWRSLAALGIAGLALAACGGDDATTDDASSPDTSETSDATTGGAGASSAAGDGDGVLTIGTLLPQTGSLAVLGPPEFAGVELAVQEINENGGFLGEDLVQIDSDSGDTTTDIATQSTTRLLSEGADVIVGAAASSVTFTVIDQITGAGVVQFSPANTALDLTDYDDNGLFFRTAPSDLLQGRILGDVVIQDGCLNVAVLNLDDPYGSGLAGTLTESIEAGGGTLVTDPIVYPEGTDNFSAQVTQVANAGAECVVIIGFAETSQILNEMVAQGLSPAEVPTYFVDGNLQNFGQDFPPGTLDGNKGTLPGAEAPEAFQARLLEVDPALQDFSYSAESYDAVVVSYLAALSAESDSGVDIAAAIPDVTREGTKCATAAECAELIEAGEDIDYDGVSGPIEMDDNGNPTEATIGVYQYGPDNTYTRVDSLSGTL